MKTAIFNRFTLDLPNRCVEECSAQGACDDAVSYWNRLDPVTKGLDGIDPEAIRAELKEYGAWNTEELANDDDNRLRIIWIAACTLKMT